jgi:transglutaminase-like putative cysteine protease
MQLRAQSASDADFARAVLAWFRDNGLEYTLEPGVTSVDSVDTTLFDSKRGFCGHFASAYAMMMRAAGVPARVVTGYFGGEWNPVGGYLIVRQSDAHAWTEVWLEGKGWTRIDPTAVIAPER